jgi:N-formylglutamate deformylase
VKLSTLKIDQDLPTASKSHELATHMSLVILHIPHSSNAIPAEHKSDFLISDDQIELELLRMTDHYTDELFSDVPGVSVIFPLSRLVIDVERFEDDAREPMSQTGMGVIYERTHDRKTMKRQMTYAEREKLIGLYYRPHHEAFELAVERAIDRHGKALIIDCHSYPSSALPYEIFDHSTRPEIGIGTDSFHTSCELASKSLLAFARRGFSVALNKPFPGAITPLKYFGIESRVKSIMIEVRRDMYMDESSGTRLDKFGIFKNQISEALMEVIAEF